MITVKEISELDPKQNISGDERIPVSSGTFITPRQIAALVMPQFVITTDEAFALAQRDGKVYIVIPK